MRIYIITMEDPLYTLPFIKEIIARRKASIAGVAISKGGRLKIGKKRSKSVYLMSLLLIMGIGGFVKNTSRTLSFKLKRKLSQHLKFVKDPGLAAFCASHHIPVKHIGSPNDKAFLEELRAMEVDVIINQSQYIVKKELLSIPSIGMLNRHNALLPKNRGRLTPFWVLFKEEKETGVSIHFVDEGMDSGPIVVQERFAVDSRDDFNTVVEKNYQVAPKAMLKALDLLSSGTYELIQNLDSEATINTIPTFNEALKYRMGRLGLKKTRTVFRSFKEGTV
jgi:methionyl-tRNA formyltransferase